MRTTVALFVSTRLPAMRRSKRGCQGQRREVGTGSGGLVAANTRREMRNATSVRQTRKRRSLLGRSVDLVRRWTREIPAAPGRKCRPRRGPPYVEGCERDDTMPSPPNPYFIYIELFWPDGHRANQNEIARVKATDVNGSVLTDEGQSGWDPNTGGWQPIFMQNIAAFQARGAPNLRFDVISTQEVTLFTTQVFNTIASGSTVRIIIGQSATIVGGGTGPTTFTLTGHARKLSNSSPFFPGNVHVSDITNGSEALIGNTILASDGSYTLSFTSDQFTNNGVSHVQPNLKVRLFDPI